MHREIEAESITFKFLLSTSRKVNRSNILASLFFIGSLSKTPSTFVAFKITSALISMARRAAAVSVEKKGFPVPAARITMRPFSKMPRGSAANIGLHHLLNLDRREDPGMHAGFF